MYSYTGASSSRADPAEAKLPLAALPLAAQQEAAAMAVQGEAEEDAGDPEVQAVEAYFQDCEMQALAAYLPGAPAVVHRKNPGSPSHL